MLKVLKYAFISGIAWVMIHSIYIINDGLTNTKQNADLAVVPGNKINEDGTLSSRLKARLDESLELYRKKQVKKILVSGGLGKEGYWEGNEMKKYLIENKIPSENIITDNYGDTTEKTVINSIKIADSLKYKSIITVSQYYHQTRIKKLFKEHHFDHVTSSSPIYFEIRDLYSIFREFFAYYL
ncbi:vancomycin permeability regulator SanA [Chryseobacterium sp. 52]|uniref:YdcF family protein n=1 Tax=Chryseobacterium sp. 52 TaxID=2035213 RepID=UPI000C18E9CC|nr:YdcF family protein [Chryseobacterium sp. 52]PIF47695.1 vancomycin permeability regulator SanA [Chryseobacterium sp. 52]